MDAQLIAHLKIIEQLYMEDRLDRAMEVVQDAFERTGWPVDSWIAFYNSLVCEKDARDAAIIHKVNDKLSIELDRTAPSELYEDLKAASLEAMQKVEDVFQITYTRPVLITIFLPDAPVDFIIGSHGYYINKTEMDKICFPWAIINERPMVIIQSLMHELTHAAIHELAGDAMPFWLGEGLAIYVSGDLETKRARFLVDTAVRSRKMLSMRRIQVALMSPKLRKDDANMVLAAYYLAGSIVQSWVQHFGFENIHKVLIRIGQGDDLERAVKRVLHVHLREIERRWREGLGR